MYGGIFVLKLPLSLAVPEWDRDRANSNRVVCKVPVFQETSGLG